MNTSLSWMKMYVPELDVTAQEYTDAMTLSGTKVEGFTKLDADLEKIVIGQIEKIEKHPDADKLIICQVNIGSEVLQIVTGAPNVKEGDKVPVVLDGGRVAGGHDGKMTPGGIKIKGGYKSMAYALVFRDHDKTLEESEISAAMKKILNGLEGLGIELRS